MQDGWLAIGWFEDGHGAVGISGSLHGIGGGIHRRRSLRGWRLRPRREGSAKTRSSVLHWLSRRGFFWEVLSSVECLALGEKGS